MKTVFVLLGVVGFLSPLVLIQEKWVDGKADAKKLVGSWTIDLRATPDAEGYFQEFVVTSVEGNEFKGTFYGSPIEEGRINSDWGKVHFGFVTKDGSGTYHHAGSLKDGKLEGTTLSLGRDFLSVWSGVAKKD